MDQSFDFPVFLTADEAGKYLASFPDFPEAIADGQSRDEALQQATRSLTEALSARIEAGEQIPFPSEVSGDAELIAPAPYIIAIARRHCEAALGSNYVVSA